MQSDTSRKSVQSDTSEESMQSSTRREFMQSNESNTNDSKGGSGSGDTQMRNNPEVSTGRYPRRERKSPAYLSDYVSDPEGDDQALSNVDVCYRVCISTNP